MQVPGFIWTALIAGATTLLLTLQTGISADVTDYWGPVAIAAIGALLKAIETWKQPDDGIVTARSLQAPRGRLSRFFLG